MSRFVCAFTVFFLAALPSWAADQAVSALISRSLKCWENGKLVVDEKKVVVSSASASGGAFFIVERPDGTEIIVYPRGGMCVLVEK